MVLKLQGSLENDGRVFLRGLRPNFFIYKCYIITMIRPGALLNKEVKKVKRNQILFSSNLIFHILPSQSIGEPCIILIYTIYMYKICFTRG